jgi:hypothetical protein
MPSLRLRDMSLEQGLSFRQMRVLTYFGQVVGRDVASRFYLLRGLHRELV